MLALQLHPALLTSLRVVWNKMLRLHGTRRRRRRRRRQASGGSGGLDATLQTCEAFRWAARWANLALATPPPWVLAVTLSIRLAARCGIGVLRPTALEPLLLHMELSLSVAGHLSDSEVRLSRCKISLNWGIGRMLEELSVPLYHGTSTLFLSGILEHGLGGENPIARWRVLEFAQRIWPLVATHLAEEDDWMLQAQSFEWMCEQRSSNFNFQHGHAYLSPSEQTAVRYAVDKRYGSELLSYTLELLGELVRRNVVRKSEFTTEYSELFKLLGCSFAPMLVEISNVVPQSLLDEGGNDPRRNIEQVAQTFATRDSDFAQCMLQQTNFRLAKPAPLADLSFWLLDLRRGEHSMQGVRKHLIYVHGSRNGGLEADSRAGA